MKTERMPDGDLPGAAPASATASATAPVLSRNKLPPKGACWYCERPLDSVRRFCGKECASAFDEEAQYGR